MANLIDALDLLVDRIDLKVKVVEITVIHAVVKACSKTAVILRDRAQYIADCVEEDERSRYGNRRR